MKILIKSGRIIDPANNIDKELDILMEGSKISRLSRQIKTEADVVIDASNKIVMPGIVDMHVHLREPGREDKETIESGTMAALKGGVSSLLAMPNTFYPIDCPQQVRRLRGIIEKTAKGNVFISGTVTKKRLGRELTDFAKLKEEGIIAVTDDGSSVDDEALLFEAFREARKQGILVICHCEDKSLSGKGVVNLGIVSTRMGLRGISNQSEYSRVERDISLAEKAGSAVHIAHVSCRESVEIIAAAKKRGVRVTAEAAPHHFSLSDEEVLEYDTNMKMNPPLRSKADVDALKQALKEGIIDVIASDHAPHTENEKDIEFERAEFGVIGLETELSVCVSELIEKKVLSWKELADKLSASPAKILGIDKGTLSAGGDADIVIISPDKEWVVKKEEVRSKSKNSPFINKKLKGVVEYTICGGEIVYESE